jgi:hypothetical protein
VFDKKGLFDEYWAKMMSFRGRGGEGKLTALAYHPTNKLNKS